MIGLYPWSKKRVNYFSSIVDKGGGETFIVVHKMPCYLLIYHKNLLYVHRMAAENSGSLIINAFILHLLRFRIFLQGVQESKHLDFLQGHNNWSNNEQHKLQKNFKKISGYLPIIKKKFSFDFESIFLLSGVEKAPSGDHKCNLKSYNFWP